MDMNWLKDIICLERSRSFTMAARERNITQPALSRRVKSLEAWLDTSLIDRTSYPVRLTPAGEAFLPVARQIVTQLQQARQELQDSAAHNERLIRIAAPHSIASNFLARKLAVLHLSEPRLRTQVLSDNVVMCFDLFSQGFAEFLVTYRHPAMPMALDPARFSCTDLGTERILPVACPDMIRERGWSLPGSSDRTVPFLTYDRNSFLGGVVAHIIGSQAEPLHLRTRHTDAFAEAIKATCISGSGVAWLPYSLVRDDLSLGRLAVLGDGRWEGEMQLSLYTSNETSDDDRQMLSAALTLPD